MGFIAGTLDGSVVTKWTYVESLAQVSLFVSP